VYGQTLNLKAKVLRDEHPSTLGIVHIRYARQNRSPTKEGQFVGVAGRGLGSDILDV
jgi:hypothetical protein